MNKDADYTDSKFKKGQVWAYKTREQEENSYLTILKVEKYDKQGIVIHVAVSNVQLQNPDKEGGISDKINHLPFSRQALDESVVAIRRSNCQIPNFTEGYLHWANGFEEGKAGVFTVPVAEAVAFVEHSIKGSKVTE